jgi:predicted amidohydrolase
LKSSLAIAACQMTSVDNWQENREQALELAHQAIRLGPTDLICFPENALYFRVDKNQPMPSIELESDLLKPFEEFARQNNCYIYFGSIPLNMKGETYNSTVILTPQGERVAPYQKIHLFDITLEGQEPIKESDEFAYGAQPSVVDIKGWKLGLSICYDLRFSELYHKYQEQEVDLIGIPAAFLVKTGQAHWHVMVRARAIESQCFVVAAAQSGSHGGQRETYGHSLIVSPWGEVLAEASDSERVKRVVLDHSQIQKVRTQIPMKNHRRL